MSATDLLSDRRYSARHFEAITKPAPDKPGDVNAVVLRQWVKRNFLMEIEGAGKTNVARPEKGTPGRPRDYHVWHVYQVAIMWALKRAGVDLDRASRWSKVVVNHCLQAKAAGERPRLAMFELGTDNLFVVPESDIEEFFRECAEAYRKEGGSGWPPYIMLDIDTVLSTTMATLTRMNDADDAANAKAKTGDVAEARQ